MRKIYLFLIALLTTATVHAQTAASYGFSAFSRSFSSITGVTGVTSTTALRGDDLTLTSIGIGFNFSFCGTTYTRLSACSNGWLSLANTSDYGYSNTNTLVAIWAYPTPGSGFLMGFWDDLHGGGHTAYYITTGTAPNRIFTFEWANFHTFSASGNATFQIKLYETTNVIEYCYGGSTYSSVSATIGIANSTSDYQTLPNRGTSPTPSSSTFTTSLSGSPATDQVYQWSPNCLTVVAAGRSPICSGDTLRLTSTVTGGTATGYSWSGPGGFSSTQANPLVPGAATAGTGVYTLSVSSSACTVSDTAYVRVDTTPTATITGTTAICSGSSASMTVTGTAGATVYYRVNGGTTTSTTIGASGTVTIATGTLTTGGSAATYSYVLSSATMGSCSRALTDSAVVTVNPNPPTIGGPSAVCVGQTITLTNTATGGSWSTSAAGTATVNSTGDVTGIAAGSVNITYTLPTGCYNYTAITVNGLPSAITGPAAVCAGSTATYTSAPTGGTWSSSPVSVATIGTASGLLNALSAGTTIVTYTTTAGCTDTALVTVNITPTAITGPSAVCVGSVIADSSAPAGGTWSVSSGIATVSSTGSIGGITSGTVTVSYTIGSCYVTRTITVNSLPAVASGPRSVCVGSTITQSSTPTMGTWSSSAASVASVGAATGVITGVSPGTAIITYTLGTGCYITDTVTVNSLPSSISGAATVCERAQITLSATPAGGTWSASATGTVSIDAATGIATGVAAGTATITYTVGSSCYSTRSVTVLASPSATAGPAAVCVGATIVRTSTPSGGVWTTSNAGIASATAATGGVTGVAAGGAFITYTTSNGCFATDTITVNPLPAPISGPSAVCIGSTTFYTTSGGAGTWGSTRSYLSYNMSSGGIDAVTAGPDTLTFTFTTTGCSTSLPVLINPLPTAIGGTLSACEHGGTTTLTDTSWGGRWYSSDTTMAVIDSVFGMLTGVNAGTVNIIYMLPSTGCSTSVAFTVNPLPGAIAGPASVCVGTTNFYSSTGGAGSWSNTGTAIAYNSTSGGVDAIATGTDTLVFTLSATGCAISTPITVNQIPSAIGGTLSVCEFSTTTLTNAVAGGTWSSSNTAIATADTASGVITGVAAGTVTITYALGSGCQTDTSFVVNATPAAISGATDVCLTYSTVFTDASTGGTWSSDNVSVATISTGGTVTGVATGTATISYTFATGCTSTAPITVNALPTAISGPTNVCVNSSAGMTDGTSGGNWSSSNTSIATIDPSTGVVTGVAAGTANITYTIGTGCFEYTAITVDPLPASITGTPSVCEGYTVTLSNATGTGSWSSANPAVATVSSGGVVTGVASATTSISYTLATGCAVGVSFTVNPVPLPIAGPTDVCEAGGIITLTDPTSGGTWSTSNASIGSIDGATGVATGVAAGTVTITYTRASCFALATVTVRALPGATITPIGDTIMCPGDFVLLTANSGTGYTYQWYNGATAISGETNDYYVAYTAGNYGVMVTNSYGCSSLSVPMSVTVNAPTATASAAAATSFCSGSTVTLNAGTGAGLTYQWVNGTTAVAGATGASFNAGVSGSYRVIVTNTAGCTATSTPAISVTVLPAPSTTVSIGGPLTFCSGGSVTLTADTGATLTYQWQNSGVDIAGATNITYSATTSGNYQVVVTNGATCSAASAVIVVNALALPSATISAAGPTTFCAGSGVVLNTPVAAGNTYQWYRNGTAVAGATGPGYYFTNSGNYTVRVTNTSGCTNTTATPEVVTEVTTPIVVPLSPLSFCWGGSSLLGMSVATSTGVSYQWMRSGIALSGATAATYNANTSGNYSCVVNIASGSCTLGSTTVSVVEFPLPNPVITWNGTTLSTGNFYTSYQWYRNLSPVAAGTTWFITPTDTGDYTVRVTDTNGCQSVATAFILSSLHTTGVQQLNSGAISIYPNPARDLVMISGGHQLKAIINSVDGRRLMEQEDAQQIDISQLANGTYMIMLYDKTGQLVKAASIVKSSE